MPLPKQIAHLISHLQQDKPILVAFDGVDTSGKTTLANSVYDCLKRDSKNTVQISIDCFHHPKEIRLQKGDLSPEGFFNDSFNIEKILEYVLIPVKEEKPFLTTGLYDYRSEQQIEPAKIPVTPDLIVLFDGIFLNRDELFPYWDLSIFLDVTFETVLKRAIVRDADYFGSVDEVIRRYQKRYIPGEELYLSTCSPKDRAHIVIDNNNWDHPVITKGKLT